MNSLKSVTVGFSNDIANKRGPDNANSSNLHKLFQNLPKIQSLKLENYSLKNRAKDQQTTRIGTMADFWEDHRACCLEQAQVVSMGSISGSELELELMKFMLTSPPKLQTMTIRPNSTCEEGKLLRELLRSQRASTQAEVIFT
ncbi:uncharacterized protein LOC125313876 [Rhodamnia argentea]|uniref:Uncharacterized protein LOC125313876 n=1 Tax=Rhodamnia argentea TaxID=178133 RepID=A0ABM3H2B9_9MYRT|nr:uncharacterized protein LOC125313876 [Rhodamnia argentea]